MDPADLPIHEIRDDLLAALERQPRLVLQAPTGSGKSTQVPQMLRDSGICRDGTIVVLQPRRIAARMLARRVAQERGVKLGDEVGYRVRFEGASSRETRILYVTEGILLRRMQDEPELPDIAAILFDEFHERHLFGDITLARALQVQQAARPDLKLVVMSATLDAGPLEEYLAPAGSLSSEGRTFPVDIRYSANADKVRDRPVWEQAAWHAGRLAQEGVAGDFLIFMPGAYEINQTVRHLQAQSALNDAVVLPLFGDLPPEQQDAALADHGRRKVVVSTNVAETSLTIDGVRVVIDSGLAKIPQFDPHRGINTLLTVKIAGDSADQRAGRAGRTAPGLCLRLWSEREHRERPARTAPEIHRVELAETLLSLKAGGIDDLDTFPWFEAPQSKSLERARMLLRDLGALDRNEAITDLGHRLAQFPLHPRYGRMFIEADRRECLPVVTRLAAFTQVRDFVLPLNSRRDREARDDLLGEEHASDFFLLLRAWQLAQREKFNAAALRKWGIHGAAARQAGQIAHQFQRIAREQGLNVDSTAGDGEAIRRCILAAFSDQLAVRLDAGTNRCAVVHGRKGELRRQSVVGNARLFVSADIEERDVRGDVTVLLGLNSVVEEAWLEELFPDDFEDVDEVSWDRRQKRVVVVRERRFRDLVLESDDVGEPTSGQAARILAGLVVDGEIAIKAWGESVEAWIRRVNFLSANAAELEIEPIDAEARRVLIEQICEGCLSAKEVRDRDPWPILRDWLLPEQIAVMDEYAPERLMLPGGSRGRIRYTEDGEAILSATVQQLYGVDETPRIAMDRVPVKVEVLAPNRRPVQITQDMAGFWENSYPQIRKDLFGRYPKHEWR